MDFLSRLRQTGRKDLILGSLYILLGLAAGGVAMFSLKLAIHGLEDQRWWWAGAMLLATVAALAVVFMCGHRMGKHLPMTIPDEDLDSAEKRKRDRCTYFNLPVIAIVIGAGILGGAIFAMAGVSHARIALGWAEQAPRTDPTLGVAAALFLVAAIMLAGAAALAFIFWRDLKRFAPQRQLTDSSTETAEA